MFNALSGLMIKIHHSAPPHLSFLTVQRNPFPSISGLEACYRGPVDQYLPSLNHRIICLSGLLTEALNCDINLGMPSTIWEGHASIQPLLNCTYKGWINQSIISVLHIHRTTTNKPKVCLTVCNMIKLNHIREWGIASHSHWVMISLKWSSKQFCQKYLYILF